MNTHFKFTNRPFSIEPITRIMLPDGIFDGTFQVLEIAFHVTNRSSLPLKWAWVRPDQQHNVEWAYIGDPFTELSPMAPGASRLVRWPAVFRNCSPGKKTLRIEFGCQIDWDQLGGGFDGFEERTIFVSRTTQDEKSGTYFCEVPEGTLALQLVKRSVVRGWDVTDRGPDGEPVSFKLPSIAVIQEIIADVTSSSGNEDKIPFSDPWWKIVAWVVAVIAAIAAIVAAKEGEGTRTSVCRANMIPKTIRTSTGARPIRPRMNSQPTPLRSCR